MPADQYRSCDWRAGVARWRRLPVQRSGRPPPLTRKLCAASVKKPVAGFTAALSLTSMIVPSAFRLYFLRLPGQCRFAGRLEHRNEEITQVLCTVERVHRDCRCSEGSVLADDLADDRVENRSQRSGIAASNAVPPPAVAVASSVVEPATSSPKPDSVGDDTVLDETLPRQGPACTCTWRDRQGTDHQRHRCCCWSTGLAMRDWCPRTRRAAGLTVFASVSRVGSPSVR